MRVENHFSSEVSCVASGIVGWRMTYCRSRIIILLRFLDVHEIIASERNDRRKWGC
jgi:hypothetical protein